MPNIMTEISRREATVAENETQFRGTPSFPRLHEPWKLIEGSLEEKEIRVYTRTDSREHKFWGVTQVGSSMKEFWAKHDSEGRRNKDACAETERSPGLEPELSQISHSKRSKSPTEAAATSRTRRKTSDAKPYHSVKNHTITQPKVHKNPRRSLSSKADKVDMGMRNQVREVGGDNGSARGGPSQSATDIQAYSIQQTSTT